MSPEFKVANCWNGEKKLSKNAPNLTENLQFITISSKNTQKIK